MEQVFGELVLDPLASRRAEAEAVAISRALLAGLGDLGSSGSTLAARLIGPLKQRKLLQPRPTATGLQAVIADDSAPESTRVGAWLLLAELADQDAKSVSWEFLKAQWEQMRESSGGYYWSRASGSLLRAIAGCSAAFPQPDAARLAETMFVSLRSLSLGPPQIAAYCSALSRLCGGEDEVEARKAMSTWTQSVLEVAEKEVSAYIDHLRTRPVEQVAPQGHAEAAAGGFSFYPQSEQQDRHPEAAEALSEA